MKNRGSDIPCDIASIVILICIRMSRKTILFCSSAILLVVVFTAGVLVGSKYERSKFVDFFSQIHTIRDTGEGYLFTEPFLGTQSPPATDIGILSGVRSEVQQAGDTAEKNGTVTDYGMYFRSLSSPFWFGVNQDQDFLPASLYKVPIALLVYKEIESGELSSSTSLKYTQPIANENAGDASQSMLVVGQSYTIQSLVQIMLEQSDNGAKNLLGSVLEASDVAKLWQFMNLGDPEPDQEVSARDYSFFFLVLYNSTYLNSSDSEAVLSMLASSTYSSALVAGVPNGVQVSHKWGLSDTTSASSTAPTGEIELHDCGIVYQTGDPYILCVMAQGPSQDDLSSFIANISSIVYNHDSIN